MSFSHTLSYQRAVARNVQRVEEKLSLYKGSSFNRKTKKSDEQKINALNENEAISAAAFEDRQAVIQREQLPEKAVSICTVEEAKLDDPSTENNALGISRPRKRDVHVLSRRSKVKIREKIFALHGSAGASRFTFLTLTFISLCADKEAQKCLNKFLTVLRTKYGKFLYLWVAERQHENHGNIHFHLICNKRFPIKEINSLWVLQQYNSGITHEKYSITSIINHHHEGTMQTIFNPVDVTTVRDIDGLSGYLTKYITKNNDEFSCSAWHCCRGVSRLFTSANVTRRIYLEAQDPSINFTYSKKTGEVFEAKTVEVKDKKTGTVVANVTYILNKSHFKKHLTGLDRLNEMVTSDYLSGKGIDKEDFTQMFVYSRSDLFDLGLGEIHLQ